MVPDTFSCHSLLFGIACISFTIELASTHRSFASSWRDCNPVHGCLGRWYEIATGNLLRYRAPIGTESRTIAKRGERVT